MSIMIIYIRVKIRLTLNLPIGGFELFTLDSKRKCTNNEKYEIWLAMSYHSNF